MLHAGPREIVIAGEPDTPAVNEMLAAVRGTLLPQRVVALAHAGSDQSLVPLTEGKEPADGGARAFLCRNYACGQPADDAATLREQLAAGES